MKAQTIEIVEGGRGPHLSTNRITVQDLVPYFRQGCSREHILTWMPALTLDELLVVERYYRDHQAELDEVDKRIRARTEEAVLQQRLRFPEEPPGQRLARMKATLRERQERNGAGDCRG